MEPRTHGWRRAEPDRSHDPRRVFLPLPLMLIVVCVGPTFAEPAWAVFPLSVRLAGTLHRSPPEEPDRERDLLALEIAGTEIYLQVDEFFSSNREHAQGTMLRDIQIRTPHLRVINPEILAPLLSVPHLQKPIRLSGILYRTSGRLAVLSAGLEEPDAPAAPVNQPNVYFW